MKKKYIKIIFIVVGVLICLILLDTLQARIFKTSPIISWQEKLTDDSWVDKGILIDTYYCTKEKDILTINWEFKKSKFTCPIDDIIVQLNAINNKIIEYFSSYNVSYDNLSFNYVDEENKVVIVGLLDNSQEQQNKFRKVVVDSKLIKFAEKEQFVDHITKEELNNIKDNLERIVSNRENYTNFASCYIDETKKLVIVELVDNSSEQQDWFKKHIIDSKYLEFRQGGPYTTSNINED